MSLFDNTERIGARETLNRLQIQQVRTSSRRQAWTEAYLLLGEFYTRDRALADPDTAEKRLQCLNIREPVPAVADYVPPEYSPYFGNPIEILHATQRNFEIGKPAYDSRERARSAELQYARAVCLMHQRKLWPPHIRLDPIAAEIVGIEDQVAAQNESIDRRISVLSTLLTDGLKSLQLASQPGTDGGEAHTENDQVSRRIEQLLSASELVGPSISLTGRSRAAFLPETRRVVVEHRLPDLTIIPAATKFRRIKSEKNIKEDRRPASQTKSIYADTIAQVSLLCIATVFAATSEGVENIIFNGVVDTVDRGSGQPCSPCLVSAEVTRQEFREINLAQVDPQTCLKYLRAEFSKSPADLVPVEPIIAFAQLDPRFVS